MNILLWILQVLLALHTAMGAVWKFSNTAQTIPSLKVIPHDVWLLMSGIELLCALALVAPIINKSQGKLVPIAAGIIAAEMLLFCGLDLASGVSNTGHLAYWLVVAAFSAFIAYGRLKLKPIQ